MILSSDDTVRPIPRYMVLQLPWYKFKRGEKIIMSSHDTVMDHREIGLFRFYSHSCCKIIEIYIKFKLHSYFHNFQT